MKPPKLATERLIVGAFAAGDEVAMFGYASDPQATRYMGWPRHQSLAESKAVLGHWLQGYESPSGADLPLAIRSKQDGRLLGSTGLHELGEPWASTGWILDPKAEGQGIAREALGAVMDWARGVLPGSGRIHASVHPDNARSVKLALALGFRQQGSVQLKMPNLDGQEHALLRFTWEPRACRP